MEVRSECVVAYFTQFLTLLKIFTMSIRWLSESVLSRIDRCLIKVWRDNTLRCIKEYHEASEVNVSEVNNFTKVKSLN